MRFTLKSLYQSSEEIKKSRFITFAVPLNCEDDINTLLNQYCDRVATHNCWAWKLGNKYKFNDDGEPTSTAGKPILAAIEGKNCDNVLVIVTRYFGGIKLGTGGLIRAYGGCASRCIQQAELTPIIKRIDCKFFCQYNEWAIIQNRLVQNEVIIQDQDFNSNGILVNISLEKKYLTDLNLFIMNLTKGREKIKILK